ncbi:LPXTG cell wall anchor domain-containing protein [Streptomyces sp. NPDC059875]|uniref:LPXTG cell wall anchor domain-containing protein n=1 Tax=unclassified Streptomyces TaxID=2593676 RepID=UPI00364D8E25
MKIRRILATAVAAAVTTPVVFLSAAPAFADTKPAAPAQTQDEQPSIEQLKLAVAAAQKAYDAAVVAEADLQKALDALAKDDHPLVVAAAKAKKAAEEAATAKTAADAKVTETEAALAALPADATPEQKAAAEAAVAEAKTAAETAAAAKTAADTKAAEAATAVDDKRVALLREAGAAKVTKDEALKALKAAEKALEDAEAEVPVDDCVEESKLTVGLTGPKKVVAGTSAVFTLKITNGTGKSLDEVGAYAEAFNMDSMEDKDLDKYLDLSWSTAANPEWQHFDEATGAIAGAVKPGGHADIKLRLTVDAKSPAGDGIMFAAGGYENNDGSCGWSKEAGSVEFDIVAKSKPGTGTGTTGGGNTNTTGQGGTSTTAVNGGGNGNTATNGSLAKTGSNDAVPQIALAGAAAVVLGAGAMVVVRRRKAGSNA